MSLSSKGAQTLSHWERVAAEQPGEGLQSPAQFIGQPPRSLTSVLKTATPHPPPPAAPSPKGRGLARSLEAGMRRPRRMCTRDIRGSADFFDDPVEPFLNFVVGEAKLDEPVTFNDLAAGGIACDLIAMLLAVEFNRQPETIATEVRDVISDWALSAEFQSIKLPVAELSPKHVFGRRALGPQTPCNPGQSVRHAAQFERRNSRPQPLTRRLRRHPLPLGEGAHTMAQR